MKRLLTIVLLLCVGSCSEKPPVLAKLPEHAVVLAFGDSLTYGSGVSEQYAYPEVLSARTGLDVINEGRPGEITRDGKARLPA
ncbi:MAG: arylesterase, partial [Gammaproteobacteria bacterium]